ncbi:sporulation-specific N-acetylmuramoyl-L-alanine amidase CwlC,N-acetylmuramoyl-L-alanine amidase LytC precursor,N-acetylmuramoyl-l-alanine amidase I,N-acetylmuramoyl-L-alanine amidase CwlD,N-acetylmuramoyl-L-alanine amidase [[Clostridium] sordellii]|uniref:N-acetylmuramoyl-L-alanine amidase n=1 Tax=Paraclostridium sordellii TaxID=1505 RepID=UPI00054405CF|nr:N-acetylmuramoyl-L-alanine amidase [Paeniclostridium sordellii]CEK34131.1 sporulation-specific N-acetylmuramoyl-L-alanine amidase CwlC,N-acetylmuramoyl-L-alanine amidase LytC precursor,N-acetylmuramoyl-l-alanine amidase I,N-acetylmuramoyl-L-alanine amidase CwlD,N-acetylmuramoyl-L-alanine amidase [[Clostridium] sordellii] [Paeniclostridium sordellii]
MKTNMIDAGHGGYDSGAPGLHGCLEKDIVLEVSNKINKYLKTQDIKNINTRTTDVFVTLNERSNKANSLRVNSFVSIHCNSSDNLNAQGLETYCYKFKYRPLADAIHSEIIREGLYTKNRGVKEGSLHVTRETNMDACLVELGFITNEEDYNLIMNNKDRFAKAIAKGICKFNGVPWKESSNTTSNEGFKNGDYLGRKARVIADVLNVRYDRGTQYNVIGQVKNGDIVNLQYCLNEWISIEGFNGNKGLGYVNCTFLELI